MSDESAEVFRRLGDLEKEVYSMSKQLTAFTQERPLERITKLEMTVAHVEEISDEMSIRLTTGLTALEDKAKQIGNIVIGFCSAMGFMWGALQAWPFIKELLVGALQ